MHKKKALTARAGCKLDLPMSIKEGLQPTYLIYPVLLNKKKTRCRDSVSRKLRDTYSGRTLCLFSLAWPVGEAAMCCTRNRKHWAAQQTSVSMIGIQKLQKRGSGGPWYRNINSPSVWMRFSAPTRPRGLEGDIFGKPSVGRVPTYSTKGADVDNKGPKMPGFQISVSATKVSCNTFPSRAQHRNISATLH